MSRRPSDCIVSNTPVIVACVGIASWKRQAVRAALSAVNSARPRMVCSAQTAVAIARRKQGAVGVWPSRMPANLRNLAASAGVPVVQIEDGFLRSNGLGAECRPPLSLVIDTCGIYFDPRTPSDLEQILTHRHFDAALTARADALVASIIARGVTKYNLPPTGKNLQLPSDRRIVLVPGQVEDDLSVQLGGAGITTNLQLLQRARQREPEAYIIYKPHPDVQAGHRLGYYPDAQLYRYADAVVTDYPIAPLLARVEAVHVLTSQTGFEALLRGREVIVYGQPFYAGWGLTKDINPPSRRGRRLTVAELAAGSLILYPHYIDPLTQVPCTPETVVDRLAAGAANGAGVLPLLRRVQGWIQKSVLTSFEAA